jgi:hypothetical protein
VTCLYCDRPVTLGPCLRDGDACNHAVRCVCGKTSTYSVNLALTQWACPVTRAVELPLFAEIA